VTGPARIRAPKPARLAPATGSKRSLTTVRESVSLLRYGPAVMDVLPRVAGNPRLRATTVLQMQRDCGNAAVARALMRRPADVSRKCGCEAKPREEQCEDCRAQATGVQRQAAAVDVIQRVSLNPLDWASDLLRSVTGDADAGEQEAQRDADTKAGDLDNQSSSRSGEFQGDAASQQSAIEGDAQARNGQITQQSTAQGAAVQSQAQTRSAQLTAQSASQGAALQQAAASASTRLESDERGLETQTRSTASAATQQAASDVSATQSAADATAASVNSRWTAVENSGTSRMESLTSQTQGLVDQRTALIEEYQSPGAHDPEAFQKRWRGLQQQVDRAEQQQGSLQRAEESASAVNGEAETTWSRMSGRGQSVMGRVESLAESAWSGFQGRWTALQGVAGQVVSGVRQRVSAAVDGLKNLAGGAWSGLRDLAGQAAARVGEVATSAWNGLKERATAAWTGLQSRATAAWGRCVGRRGRR